MRKRLPIFCWLVAVLANPAGALDLLERYPTSLTAGDTAPDHAREWQFGPGDIFRLARFAFEVGKGFKVETGPADLGVGRSADGAVWAVVLPRAGGTLSREGTNTEVIAHVWLRFHPRELSRLFPAETVSADGATNLVAQIRVIANTKMTSSWQAGGRAMIPEPKDFTVDVDTQGGPRRFFMVDAPAQKAEYVAAFEKRSVKLPPALTPELAAESFDQLWQAFDRDYAMFVLRPELDWNKSREQFRPRALACKSAYEFADVCAEMLRPLRDLHVWMTVAGANVPVFNRPRAANANPSAHRSLLGELQGKGRVQWAVTSDKVGFLAIYGWNTGPQIPAQCDEALEAMRDTRGLIVDVRLNGGGDEPTAGKVAGRFLSKGFVYAYSQFRNGRKHTNLTEKYPRKVQPRGPWCYDRPVVLLIGEKCLSSNESFIGMMTGATNVTTMGDHTGGSSGNPRIVNLPLDITVSVPRWIDYLPDGTPLDERGFQPQVRFEPKPGAFEGERDDLLAAALERLRQVPLPAKPIEGEAFAPETVEEPARESQPVDALAEFRAVAQEEARDTSRPKIVSLMPADGATSVASITELRLRFDRAMDPLSLRLTWKTGGLLDCDYPRYDSNRFEFTIPAHLAPGQQHQIIVNKPNAWVSGLGQKLDELRQQYPHEGFQSAEHRPAGLALWQFHTQASEVPTSGAVPKVTAISPAPGSTIALLTFVELQFDQPMMPPTGAMRCLDSVLGTGNPSAICRVQYNPTNRTYRIPVLAPLKEREQFTLADHTTNVPPMLTPRDRASFLLTGFRSAQGVPAAPVKLDYRVAGSELAVADRKRMEAATKEPQLLAVLEGLKQKRTQLKSVAERVQQLRLGVRSNLFSSLQSTSALFRWQSPGQFYGDASQPMLTCNAFRIGCDGASWWFLAESSSGRTFQACPSGEMHEPNVSFCDPFGLTQTTPTKAAAERGLNYQGLMNLDGDEHHVVEAWSVEALGGVLVWGELTQWWIDPRTALPAQIVQYRNSGVERTRFLYDAVNETLPASDFALPHVEGVTPDKPDILDADYTKRFVNLRDGSDGRMSVRWGKQGPKATSSSGLN